MTNTNHNFINLKHQGAVLVSTILIILIVSIMALSTVSTVTANQRVAANSIRAMDAFQAAEAGLEYGIQYGEANFTTIITDNNNDGLITYTAPTPSGGRYTVTYTNHQNPADFTKIEISSTGTSADGTVSETVRQLMYRVNFFPVNINPGLTALRDISLAGKVGITGDSNQIAIWSGGSVSQTGAVDVVGGIKANDTKLSTLTGDQFFNNFFNKSKSAAKSSAHLTFQNSIDTNYSALYLSSQNGLDGVQGKAIYITQAPGTTATINSNAVIGTPENPVILIVDGNLNLSGNAIIHGVVYVIGDWSSSGTMKIYGAGIAEGKATSTGTADIELGGTQQNLNKILTLVKVPGTWRDF